MKHNYFSILLFLMSFSFGFAQTTILCGLNEEIYITDPINVPTVTDNGDGTITLTHHEQYITDIFAKHVIYDFYQSYPSSSGVLKKLYTISFNNKDLANELFTSVPSEIFSIDYIDTGSTPISSELIDFLDGKKLNLRKHCDIADNGGEPCPEQTVPNDFDLMIEFNYDINNDLLLLESSGLTPCGNSFSMALKGGTEVNTLQLWGFTPQIITEPTSNQLCMSIENLLFSILDISCNNYNYGNITPTINTEDNTLFLYRQNLVFGYNTVTFEEDTFSVNKTFFENVKLIISKSNPNIEFSNIKNQDFYVEVFSVLGEKIIKKTRYQKNTINLNTFQNGLYIIRLSNSNNDYKIFKYLK